MQNAGNTEWGDWSISRTCYPWNSSTRVRPRKPKDASVMEKLEEKILKSLGIDSPYI